MLKLNFQKTYYRHFITNSKCLVNIPISYKDNFISNTCSIKFLGISLNSTLSWKTHIEQLNSRLNSACSVIRSLKSFISVKNLRIIYFSYVHSIITYGIIFWGISPYSHGIFKLQNRVIRIIMNADNRESCHQFFKKLQILPLYSQYIKSIALFVVKNIDEFVSNSELHSINPLNTELIPIHHLIVLLGAHHIVHVSRVRVNTRHRSDLHIKTVHLTTYQKGVYYSGIRIFHHLPQNIKNLCGDIKRFKSVLNKFLLVGSFYTLKKYFE